MYVRYIEVINSCYNTTRFKTVSFSSFYNLIFLCLLLCPFLFFIIAQSSVDVVLTSTLAVGNDGHTAPPGEEIVFTCTTRYSNLLQWSSDEYIGSDGYNIQVFNGTLGTDVRRGSANATLVLATIENGVLVLVSELRIRTSALHPTASIQCNNNGHGSSRTITFSMSTKLMTLSMVYLQH